MKTMKIMTKKTLEEIEATPRALRTRDETYLIEKFPPDYRSRITREWEAACKRLKPYFRKDEVK